MKLGTFWHIRSTLHYVTLREIGGTRPHGRFCSFATAGRAYAA